MQKVLYIPLDISNSYSTYVCEKWVNRGDTLNLVIKLYDNSVLANLTGQTVNVIISKPDGTTIDRSVATSEISNGVINIGMSEQASIVEGIYTSEVQIFDSIGSHTGSNYFTYLTMPSIADAVLAESKNELATLADIIAVINDYRLHAVTLAQENAKAIQNITDETTINNTATTNIANLNTANAKADTDLVALQAYGNVPGAVQDITTIKAEVIAARGAYSNLNDRITNVVEYNIKSLGAIGDGVSRTIASKDPTVTLAQVQALHPNATLQDEWDWYIIQKTITNFVTHANLVIHFPSGNYLISKPIDLFCKNGQSTSLVGEHKTTSTITASSTFAGSYTVQLNRNPEGLTNVTVSPMVMVRSNMIYHSLTNIFLDANYYADYCVYSYNNTSFKIDGAKFARANKTGIWLDRNTCMFNFNDMLVAQCKEEGLHIVDDCTGDKVNISIFEDNGLNVYVRNSNTITFDTCTFQMYRRKGNFLIEGGEGIFFNNCYFEGGFSTNDADGTMNPSPYTDTFDLIVDFGGGNSPKNIMINGGYLHGISTARDKNGNVGYSKYGIKDFSNSMTIDGLLVTTRYNDGTGWHECYDNPFNAWYFNSSTNNTVSIRCLNAGTRIVSTLAFGKIEENKLIGSDVDYNRRLFRVTAENLFTFKPKADNGYLAEGNVFNSSTRKRIKFDTDGKQMELMAVGFQNDVPTTGTWKQGDFVQNSTPNAGRYSGWLCLVGGTPGTWTGVGQTGVLKGTTANRPPSSVLYPGYKYQDTTLHANGKPIEWNGSLWMDMTGTTV